MAAMLTRAALRELRLTPVRLWLLAITLAMASLTAVNVFTARLVTGIERQASTLLGADLVLEGSREADATLRERAAAAGLRTATTVTFPSVVVHGQTTVLVQVKAVSDAYPLRGQLEVREAVAAPPRKLAGAPRAGEVWVGAAVLQRTGTQVGDVITLGGASLRIAKILDFEPDGGADVFQFAPRVLMAAEDLPTTGLLSPASRARYRLLVAGEGRALETLKAAIERGLAPGEKLLSLGEARPELRDPLEKTQRYLGLAGLLTAAFAGVAMFLAVRLYVREQTPAAALLRSLGATRVVILGRYAAQLSVLGALGCALGLALGLAVQAGLGGLLIQAADVTLGGITLRPIGVSLAWVVTLAALFNAAELVRLTRTAPARLLREDPAQAECVHAGWLAALLGVLAVLAAWQSGNARLAILGVAGLAALVAVQAALSVVLLGGLRWVFQRWSGGAAMLHQRRRGLLLSVTLGATLTLGLTLTFVKDALLAQWQRQIPPEAPNHFLINIQPGETTALRAFLQARGIDDFELYPMARGRLIEHNGRSIAPGDFENPRAQRLVDREFNLSASAALPADNRIVAGAWFSGSADSGFSVERGIADTLGLALGDELVFEVGGEIVRDRITSLRQVHWESLRPNFFVFLAPHALDELSRTFITSVYLPGVQGGIVAELVQRFPAVTAIDVRAVLVQVRRVLDAGGAMILVVFGLTVAAALAVLLVLLLAQREERTQELAVCKALGATTSRLRARLALEFAWLGAVTGMSSGLIAETLTWALMRRLFEVDYVPHAWPLALGVAAAWTALGIGVWLVLRGIVSASPTRLFRHL